jgi:hypothetical protein
MKVSVPSTPMVQEATLLNCGTAAKLTSRQVGTADVAFSLSSHSHDYAFADQEVKLAFDNFVVSQGQLIGDCKQAVTDTDGDGFADDVDNCPADANPDQATRFSSAM